MRPERLQLRSLDRCIRAEISPKKIRCLRRGHPIEPKLAVSRCRNGRQPRHDQKRRSGSANDEALDLAFPPDIVKHDETSAFANELAPARLDDLRHLAV